jgi:hypothetical protein
VIVYFVMRHDDEEAVPNAPSVAVRQSPTTAHAPVLPSATPPIGSGLVTSDDSVDPVAHLSEKPPLDHPQAATGGPPDVAKKPKMTLEEKLVETTKHIAVMGQRAEILEKEIADLERDGKKQEAAEQRIVLKRLRAHMEELRKAVAEKREPE